MRIKLWLFIKLTRPLFLAGGVLLFFLGAAMAWREGHPVRFLPLLTGQFLITCVQLMTHYANEYFDQETDRLNTQRTWFSGGSGVLPASTLPAKIAWQAARVTAGFGMIFLVLTGFQTPVLLLPGVVCMLAAWFYSAPPLALSGSGWGELSATVVVAGMVPTFGYTTQSAGLFSPLMLWVCLSLGLLHWAMLIAFEIPDHPSDHLVGKRTLAVRMGPAGAARIHNLALLTAVGIMAAAALSGWPGARFAWLSAPLALWQVFSIGRFLGPGPRRYLSLTLPALGLFVLTTVLWMAGFLF